MMKILTGILLGALLASCTVTHHVSREEWERSQNAARQNSSSTSNTVQQTAARPTDYYRVVKGDTLYAIAWRYRLDYKQLAWWNQIRAPYRINIGQKIYLRPRPGQSVRPPVVATRPAATRPVVTRPEPRPRPVEPISRPTTSTTPAKPAIVKPVEPHTEPSVAAASNTSEKPIGTANLKWRWPVKGALLDQFGVNPGIDIAGKYGQAVLASEAGKVVYSGRGLKGYGDLVIIKHNDTYLSAYAHNSRLLVKEGQQVYAGQSIAQLGKVADVALLHFEIRVQGEPVDPLTLLPEN